MNNLNPLIPQGSLLEQKAKGKPHLRVAYIIVAIHLVFLGGLLIQGCKRDDKSGTTSGQATNDTTLPPLNQDALYHAASNALTTNLAQQDLVTTNPPLAATQTQGVSSSIIEPARPAGTQEYVVVNHDTFSTIGKKFGVSANAIAKANPGVDSTRLKIGQKLVIPAPSSPAATLATASNGSENVYVVKSGDSLTKIAGANSTTVNEIKSLNGLKTDRIKVGDKLKMPPPKSPPAPVTTNSGTSASPPPGGTGNL